MMPHILELFHWQAGDEGGGAPGGDLGAESNILIWAAGRINVWMLLALPLAYQLALSLRPS